MSNPQDNNATEPNTGEGSPAKTPGLLRGLLMHAGLLLSFRHDGSGLPQSRSPMLYLLAACYLLAGVAMTATALVQGAPGVESIHAEIVFKLVVIAIICFFLQPRVASAYFLAATTGQLMAAGAYAAMHPLPDWALPAITAWLLAAYVRLLFAHGKRQALARKEKTSRK